MIAHIDRQRCGTHEPGVEWGRLLAQLGLTCPKQLWRAYSAGGSRQQWLLKSEYPRIRALAKREKAGDYFEDESGGRSDFHSGSTWEARGQTPS